MKLDELCIDLLRQQDHFMQKYYYSPDTLLITYDDYMLLTSDPHIFMQMNAVLMWHGMRVLRVSALEHTSVAFIGDYHDI